MNYSFSTVLMAILASNLLLILTHFLFKNVTYLVAVGYKALALIVFLTFMRLFIPLEFPFTQNIFLKGWLSKISKSIQHPYFIFHGIDISIWFFFTMIWILGAIIKTVQYINLYRKTKASIFDFGQNVTHKSQYTTILEKVYPAQNSTNKFQLIELDNIVCPMIFSFYRPCILLPAKHTYTTEQLTFIFQHEIAHYQHGDLHLKFVVQLLTIIYWWNPFCSVINKHLNAMLEMHVDDSLTHGDSTLIARYLECLLEIKKDAAAQSQQVIPDTFTLSVNDADESLLKKRFQMLTKKVKHSKILRILFIAIVCTVYLQSYLFILEPYERATSYHGNPVFTLTPDNAYIIANDNGTYDIYLYDCCIETVTSLEYYNKSIPIFQSKEDVHND